MRVFPVRFACACALVALAACGSGGDPADLSVSPRTKTVTAGGGPETFTATLTNSHAGVSWAIDGPGSLSTPTGNTTQYTPPASLASDATAKLTASSGGLSTVATVTISAGTGTPGGPPPPPPPSTLTVSPTALSVSAGGGGFAFTASGASGTVTWTLTGSGAVGSFSPATGATTTYTPPATVPSPTTATLTAAAGGQTASATITITPVGTGLGVSPAQLTVTAGTGAQRITSSGGTGTVTWSLSGPGSIDPNSGPFTDYTPPATVASATTATVTAAAGGATASTTITINPPPLSVTPSQATVTAGGATQAFNASGGSGTVSWALTAGPGSIDSTSGPTTTYTPPATVASTTTATLKATAGSETVTVTITVNPPAAPPPFTLAGKVLAFNRQPVTGASVRVSGIASPVTTDASGNFTVSNVTAPYDVYVLVGGGTPKIYGWQGLTRHDPTIYLVGFISAFGDQPFLAGTAQSTTINGTVPVAAGTASVAAFRSPELVTSIGFTAATFQTSPTWFGPPGTSGTMDILRWNTPLGSADPSYRRASHAVALSSMAGTTTVTFQASEFQNVAAGALKGALTLPAGLSQARGEVFVKLPSGARASLATFSGSAPSFAVPNVSGASIELLAGGATAGNDQAFIRKTGISPTATGVVGVTVPGAPTLSNGPNVSASTTFTWTAFAQPAKVVHVISIVPTDPTQVAFHIATAGTSFKLPSQLTGAGFSITAGKAYHWYVEGFGPFNSVDDAAAGTSGPWNAAQNSEMPLDVPLQPDVDPIYGRTAQTQFTAQ